MEDDNLKKLIELSHIVAKPWRITTYIFAVLLLLSVAGNIYLATQDNVITMESNGSIANAAKWVINQENRR